MKKFYVNERLFSIADKYDILDESGNVAYYGVRKLFKLFEEFSINDYKGNFVCKIKKQFTLLLPRYDLIINDRVVATVQKKFTFFVSKYDITSSYGDFTIDGDIFSWNFSIYQGSKLVCTVMKEFALFKDKYEIEVADFDEVIAIGLVIILDSIHHEGK